MYLLCLKIKRRRLDLLLFFRSNVFPSTTAVRENHSRCDYGVYPHIRFTLPRLIICIEFENLPSMICDRFILKGQKLQFSLKYSLAGLHWGHFVHSDTLNDTRPSNSMIRLILKQDSGFFFCCCCYCLRLCFSQARVLMTALYFERNNLHLTATRA